MITKDAIQTFFDDLKECELDSNDQLLYGYFFTDTDATKLETASKELTILGYNFVDIFQADVEEDDEPFFYLHVERVEKHTVDTLNKRNMEFYKFADKYNLESYDGFDAGPIDFNPADN